MMSFGVRECVFFAVLWAMGLVAGPAVFLVLPAAGGVAHLDHRRSVAPLVRGSLERACVLGASLLASLGPAVLLARAGTPGLLLGAPALGAMPWFAGEVLSGRSERSRLALAASVLAGGAVVGGLVAVMPAGSGGFGTTAPVCAVAVACASLPYLALRGPARARPE